jgi:hypothetical protein
VKATLDIPDDLAAEVQRRAAQEGRERVQQMVQVIRVGLSAEASDDPPATSAGPGAATYDVWRKRFDEMLAVAAPFTAGLPAGFTADDTRESIYKGRGE